MTEKEPPPPLPWHRCKCGAQLKHLGAPRCTECFEREFGHAFRKRDKTA